MRTSQFSILYQTIVSAQITEIIPFFTPVRYMMKRTSLGYVLGHRAFSGFSFRLMVIFGYENWASFAPL